MESKELNKFADGQVQKISKLQEKSNELKTKADTLKVTDDESLRQAKAIVKEINAHKSFVKEERLAYTKPLNSVIDQLIAKEKEVLLPLDEGKSGISDKILDYQAEIERKRQEEIRRVEAITEKMHGHVDLTVTEVEDVNDTGAKLKAYYESLEESDRNNPTIKSTFLTCVSQLTDHKNSLIEQARLEAERIRQEAENKRLEEERAKQSEEEARIAAERKQVEDEKRRIEEEKLQIQRDKEEMERQKEIQKAEAEALKLEKAQAKTVKAAPKVNAVTTLNLIINDENAVPREYCSPDMSKIRAAAKAHESDDQPFEIPGVQITAERKVR